MKRVLLAALLLTGGWFLGISAMQAASPGQATASSAGKHNEASVDQDISLLRQDLRSKRKQLIAASLKLTDTEATKFWPVYDQYTTESSKLGDQKYALLKEYAHGFGTLTDEQALSLTSRSLEIDKQIDQLRSKYVPIVNQVLPGTKTATFFQLDRRISELIDLQLATGVPLVQEQN